MLDSPRMLRRAILACSLLLLALGRPFSVMSDAREAGPLRFRIRFGPEQSREALDGRLLLLVSNDASKEPRFQITNGPTTQLVFGIDVDGLKPGASAVIDASVLGYPVDSIRDIPAGSYVVQGLLHRYDQHPQARYPLVIFHGHFPQNVDSFRETPPDPDLKCEYSDRFRLDCYNRIQQEQAYQFYKDWTSPGYPRTIAIEIQHANPYYDDSYAVNSANLGPYGDAITYELIPYLEKKYRAISAGWARSMYGGSTGGWEL